jgi:D-alanine transaminase
MPDEHQTPSWAWFAGRLVPFQEARVPIEDRGLQFGESLYEVVALVSGRPFRLASHVERMLRAADELGFEKGVPVLAEWEQIIAQLHGREPHTAALCYAQVTGGGAPRAFLPDSPQHPLFFAYVRSCRFPTPADVARGIGAITVPDARWHRCDLKTSMLLASVMAKREAARRGAEEAVFVGKDGYISDGASSTVFAVKRRTVLTSPPTRRTLHGTSGEVVREIARELGVPFSQHYLTLSDLKGADEVFVASTLSLLMPVVRLDSTLVGDGVPGPLSLQLAYHFQRIFWGAEVP